MPQLQQSRPLPTATQATDVGSASSTLASNEDALAEMSATDQGESTPTLDAIHIDTDPGDDTDYAAFHASLDPVLRGYLERTLVGVSPDTISEPAWVRLEEVSEHGRVWLEGYSGWVLRGAKPNTVAGGAGSTAGAEEAPDDPVYSQAVWYSGGGRPLSYDEVKHAVEVLEKYAINEGGSTPGVYVFDEAGDPEGLKSFGGTKGTKTVEFNNNYGSGSREQAWNYWFTEGTETQVQTEAMKTTGVPKFGTQDGVDIPDELRNLDLAFIPGGKSCWRAVYAMELATGDQKATDGNVSRQDFDPKRKGELLDAPLDAGMHLHLRVGKDAEEHSILAVKRVGEKYLVNDPGRNPLNPIQGEYTYADGVLSRKGKDYTIFKVETA